MNILQILRIEINELSHLCLLQIKFGKNRKFFIATNLQFVVLMLPKIFIGLEIYLRSTAINIFGFTLTQQNVGNAMIL